MWIRQQGQGQMVLDRISQDILAWNELEPHEDRIRRDAAFYEKMARLEMGDLVDVAFFQGGPENLRNLDRKATERQLEYIMHDQVYRAAVDRINMAHRGTNFEGHLGKLASLTVTEPGVWLLKSVRNTTINLEGGPADLIAMDGVIDMCASMPSQGGKLVIHSLFTTSILTGIVNEQTAMPRIELELFQKSSMVRDGVVETPS